MRYVAILGIVCLGTVSLLSGCDGEEGTTGGAGGAGGSTASSSSSGGGMASSSSSSVSGSSSTSSSSSGGALVNGCDVATAEDHLADATVNIAVGTNGSTFSPACVRVKKGTDITFTGTFSGHPFVGGVASPPTPDSASPIKPTNSGSAVTFTIDLAGTYPFYCEYHAPSMAGAIFAE